MNTDAEKPPVYVNPSDVESPPSYDSLFGKIKKAKNESDGNVDFAKTCCGIILGSFVCTVCLGIFLAIPITMIVIGAVYKDDCPAERMIPIYLIVGGSFGLLSNLVSIGRNIKAKKDQQNDQNNEEKKNPVGFEQILNCFLTAWFIAGNVWVYRTYDDFQGSNSSLDNYCHRTVYYFAFWLITSTYIIFGVLLVVCIVGCLIACCCGSKD